MKTRILIIIVLLGMLSLCVSLSGNSAYGLECKPYTISEHLENADTAFLGKAISKNYQPNSVHEDRFDAVTLFSVIEPLKGIRQNMINVTSSEWFWGANFTENNEYVVFAHNDDGKLAYTLCTPIQLTSNEFKVLAQASQTNILPPLSQMKLDVPFTEIQCKEGLILLQKYDGSPVCVKSETVPKLVGREWGTSDSWIKVSNTNQTIAYELDTGKVVSIHAFSEYNNSSLPEENKQTWLQIQLTSLQDGSLKITLPRNMIDSKIGDIDDEFFVLLDGNEVEYLETKTESERIIDIHFPAKTDIIEIVGYGYYNSELSLLEPVLNRDGTISENTNPYALYDITGLKQIYKLGELISFTETVQGYGNPCISPHYEILDGNTLESIWEYHVVYPCPFIKYPEQFEKTNIIPNNDVESPILNKTGPHILRSYHTYNDGYSVRTFTVVDDSFVRNTIDPCHVVYNLDANDYRKKTAPPTSISEYGRDATVLESFVFETSIGKMSLPSYMPSCYEEKSYKIKDDLNTLVYYPNDLSYDDTITITKIIQEGILFLVSDASQDSQQWSEHVSRSVKDAPDIQSSEVFQGNDVLLVHGIPSKNTSSTVKVVIDDKFIQIISTKLDTTYLMNILKSMFED